MPITDREVEWAQRKVAQQQQLMKDQVLASWYDMGNPAIREWVNRHFDSYENRQRAFVESKFEIMKQYARIAQTGPQNQDDLDFIYNVQTGIIQLPSGYHNFTALVTPLAAAAGGNPANTAPGTLIARGPLSLKRYTGTAQASAITGVPTNQVYPWNKFAVNNAAYPGNAAAANRLYGLGPNSFWTGFGANNAPYVANQNSTYYPAAWTNATRF